MMRRVYLVNPKRTAIGAFNGSLSTVKAVDLGAAVVKEILSGLPAEAVNETIVGQALPAGCRLGPGRQVSLLGGIPEEVPAYSLNMACGSGMKAVINAFMSVKADLGDVYVAGGIENMSLAPYVLTEARQGLRMGNKQVYDHMIYDGLEDPFLNYHMGVTAENIAEKYNISREEQDEFAYSSQVKAVKAIDSGAFKNEIIPIKIKTRKEEIIFDTDEYPNRGTGLEKLAALKPAFKLGGTVTPGSSSGINDGASFVLVVSEEALKKYNLVPAAEMIAFGQGGVDPSIMGMGPVPAIAAALKNAALKLSDIDFIEITEAFAAQILGVIKELAAEHGTTKDEILTRTNVNGGAIALGHPVGASGARIITTLSYLLKSKNKDYGLASLCMGGGMGAAVVIKKV